ncbi:MAG: outer membrane beta-barrel protein [Legionellaceae bacterium]|nr:outer membrane beta-barrel protein [Legionellaceae bacterium]
MKKFACVSLSLFCLASSNTQASDMVNGWYAGLTGIISRTPSTNFNVFSADNTLSAPGRINYSIGGGLAGQLGYRCNHWRVEVEALGNYNEINELRIGDLIIKKKTKNMFEGTTLRGRTIAGAGLINGIFDFNSAQSIGDVSPYVGLGIGYVHLSSQIRFFEDDIEIGNALNTTDNHVIGQGILGISYALDNYTMIGIDFRYLSSNKQKNSDDRYQLQTINLLFNVAFDDASNR